MKKLKKLKLEFIRAFLHRPSRARIARCMKADMRFTIAGIKFIQADERSKSCIG